VGKDWPYRRSPKWNRDRTVKEIGRGIYEKYRNVRVGWRGNTTKEEIDIHHDGDAGGFKELKLTHVLEFPKR